MTQAYFRAVRPDVPLREFVAQQQATVYVNKKDIPALIAGGAENVALLPHAGPHPGEAWLLQLELVDRG